MKEIIQSLILGIELARRLDEMSPAARAATERDINRSIVLAQAAVVAAADNQVQTYEGMARHRIELIAWRLFAPKLQDQLSQILAAQGDSVDPVLLALQHELAALQSCERSPANTSS